MTEAIALLSRYKRHVIAGSSGLLAGFIALRLTGKLFASGVMTAQAYSILDRANSMLNPHGHIQPFVVTALAVSVSLLYFVLLFAATISAPIVACVMTAMVVYDAGPIRERAMIALGVLAHWLYMLAQAVMGFVLIVAGAWVIGFLIWQLQKVPSAEIRMAAAVAAGVVIGSVIVDFIRD